MSLHTQYRAVLNTHSGTIPAQNKERNHNYVETGKVQDKQPGGGWEHHKNHGSCYIEAANRKRRSLRAVLG